MNRPLTEILRAADAADAREEGLKAVASVLDEPNVASYLRRVREDDTERAPPVSMTILTPGEARDDGDVPLVPRQVTIEEMIAARAASAATQEGSMKETTSELMRGLMAGKPSASPTTTVRTTPPDTIAGLIEAVNAQAAFAERLADAAHSMADRLLGPSPEVTPGPLPPDPEPTLLSEFERGVDRLHRALQSAQRAAQRIVDGVGLDG